MPDTVNLYSEDRDNMITIKKQDNIISFQAAVGLKEGASVTLVSIAATSDNIQRLQQFIQSLTGNASIH